MAGLSKAPGTFYGSLKIPCTMCNISYVNQEMLKVNWELIAEKGKGYLYYCHGVYWYREYEPDVL